MPLDRRDIQLLNLLQDDATLPLRTLAERVHMSVATCQRRIAQMRAEGILLRQVALVDRVRVGRPLTVFVWVELDRQHGAALRDFERKMGAEPEVLECYEISGEADFLLSVNAASMEAYHAFTRRVFIADNNVRGFKSNFVMHCAKYETKIPIAEPEAG
ncbi:Lrp/AsnC family transcriptional regulator [Ralstonia solanacearum]|uniref:Lrp/AsnC family transcriptional regulator n=1 Tax=Ralstonia solanacearum TaxID=305 RepID=UPI0006DC1465|nr:Lrp/AsnC family transcriptional regulator [Ralstonia solanacearum]